MNVFLAGYLFAYLDIYFSFYKYLIWVFVHSSVLFQAHRTVSKLIVEESAGSAQAMVNFTRS